MSFSSPTLLILWLVCGLATVRAADLKTIVFFGDSLTAGYGLDDPESTAYPGLIQKKIEDTGLPYRVVNAGLSGDTTAGGLRRIDWVLRQKIDVFVLALGGNDGLRGVDPEATRANLQGIIDRVRAKNPEVKVVLAGMQMPANMGPEFTRAFRELYPKLAHENETALVPFLLEGVGGVARLNQPDRIHPTPEGQAKIAETVWSVLQTVL